MYDLILIRYGEIALKGKNRSFFVNKLISNIKKSCSFTDLKIKRTYGRLFIYPQDKTGENIKNIAEKLKGVPGIVSFSPCITCQLDYEKLKNRALEFFKKEVENFSTTFKVETNRANKSFVKNSMEINREIGALILENIDDISVDIHNPEVTLNFDVRDKAIYIYTKTISGPGGLPVGCSGKGLLLLSGGIDSPVAGWLGMKRGIEVEGLHFHSFPYTSDRAKEKVIDLAKILSKTGNKFKLYIVHFTEIQRAIKKHCQPKYIITIMRRMMFRIATAIARKNNNLVLLTGESIGQVSSQTLENMQTISAVTDLPVLRPVITMDKQEIITIAKDIGTYETSILPHEDCCTIFVPDHPVTRPTIAEAIKNENNLNIEELIKEALEKTETLHISE